MLILRIVGPELGLEAYEQETWVPRSVDVPAGGQVVFTTSADVVAAPPQVLTSTATVTAATDPDPNDNSSDAVILVGEPVFSDGFESGDITAWSAIVGTP